MIYKITKKQYNAKMCFVCGIHNEAGLKTSFYELDNGHLLGVLKGIDVHQSYPMRMHGGIITALLDETIGRSIQMIEDDMWGVTIEITVKFLKPVPLRTPLKVVGYITENNRRLFKGEGYLCDEDNVILATAQAKYLKQAVSKIVDETHFLNEEWMLIEDSDPFKEVDLPQ
jgi:hypothetical protein